MDSELKKYRDRWLNPNFDSTSIFGDTKRALCRLIDEEQYEDASQLFNSIVSTGVYKVSEYYETGLLLTKNTGGDTLAYLEAAHRNCLGKEKISIFLRYIEALMEAGNLAAIDDTIYVWSAVHHKSQDFQDIQGFFTGCKTTGSWREYLKHRCENIPRRSQYNPSWMPNDEYVVAKYLDMLRESNSGALVQEATEILQRASKAANLALMRVTLKYYRPSIQSIPQWLEIMEPYSLLDPVGDPNIFAEPLFNACIQRSNHWDVRHPETLTEYGYVCKLLKERLKASTFDQWVVDKLSWLCESILNMSKFREQYTFSRLMNPYELQQMVEAKVSDLTLEENTAIQSLKSQHTNTEKELKWIIGSFEMNRSALRQLHTSLVNVRNVILI
ncbi:hypothetical protein BJV82DRAFT_665340 [Fennellomyces sp. T-0311]|nr:hypothetical protein BJV82DRAFT_665340 [Fennellomyces sp. T-0311]